MLGNMTGRASNRPSWRSASLAVLERVVMQHLNSTVQASSRYWQVSSLAYAFKPWLARADITQLAQHVCMHAEHRSRVLWHDSVIRGSNASQCVL